MLSVVCKFICQLRRGGSLMWFIQMFTYDRNHLLQQRALFCILYFAVNHCNMRTLLYETVYSEKKDIILWNELVSLVMLHDGGFCNVCITKLSLNNKTNVFVSFNDFFTTAQWHKMKVINIFMFFAMFEWIILVFFRRGKLMKNKSVLWHMHFRVHRT